MRELLGDRDYEYLLGVSMLRAFTPAKTRKQSFYLGDGTPYNRFGINVPDFGKRSGVSRRAD